MSRVTELVEAARDRLQEYGVDCSVRFEQSPLVLADATVALRWGTSRQRFAVHVMTAVRLAPVLAALGATPPAMVVAPWIAPRIGAQLRAAGVCYVDSVGNASIRFGTVLIEVSGRKRPARPAPGPSTRTPSSSRRDPSTSSGTVGSGPPSTGSGYVGSGPSTGSGNVGSGPSTSSGTVRTPGNLATAANRRVIAALLADRGLERATLRELAAAAGVSLGQAHKTTTLLAGAGFHRDALDDEQRAALGAVLRAIEGLQ